MKKTTKLLALVCAMLMLGSVLAGCSSTPAPSASAEATAAPEESAAVEATAAPEESAAAEGTASATPTLDAIRERGQLILGTESTYPPFEFIVIENGQSVGAGFDVMLAQKIAEKLGMVIGTLAGEQSSSRPSSRRECAIRRSDALQNAVSCQTS